MNSNEVKINKILLFAEAQLKKDKSRIKFAQPSFLIDEQVNKDNESLAKDSNKLANDKKIEDCSQSLKAIDLILFKKTKKTNLSRRRQQVIKRRLLDNINIP